MILLGDVETYPSALLDSLCYRILTAAGATADDARAVTDGLMWAELKGVESHGLRLLPVYLKRLRGGQYRSPASIQVADEGPSWVALDAGSGFGIVAATKGVDLAIERAQTHGIGLALVRNSNHFGAAGFYATRAAAAGMLGLVHTNAPPAVAPWGGRNPLMGTNPIAICAPSTGPDPLLLDMATSVVAKNRVYAADQKGYTSIAEGWCLGPDGTPTTDVQEALKGTMAPVGTYKGYGLSLFIDVLCGALTGGRYSWECGRLYFGTEQPELCGHFFLVMDASRMAGRQFPARVQELIDVCHAAEPAKGVDRVLVPGEPEFTRERARRREGIPMHPEFYRQICGLAAEFGVPLQAV